MRHSRPVRLETAPTEGRKGLFIFSIHYRLLNDSALYTLSTLKNTLKKGPFQRYEGGNSVGSGASLR